MDEASFEGDGSPAAAAAAAAASGSSSSLVNSRPRNVAMPSLDKIGIYMEVNEPEKHGEGLEAFVSFKVSTWTTWKHFQSEEFSVRRRYNDFVWLRDEMHRRYPTMIIPPLPERYRLDYLDRFSPEFLERRRRGLETFLLRIASHPTLRDDFSYAQFLEAKSWALETTKSAKLQNSIEDAIVYAKQVVASKPKNPLDKLENIRNYTAEFEAYIASMDRLTSVMLKHKSDVADVQTDLAAAMLLLGNSEVALTLPLQNISKAFDLSSKHIHDTVSAEDTSFVDPLKEYVLYGENIRRVQRHADMLYLNYENATAALEDAKIVRASLDAEPSETSEAGISSSSSTAARQAKNTWFTFMTMVESAVSDMQGVPPAQAKAERIAKADKKIADLELALTDAKRAHEESLQEFMKEMDRFNTDKIMDFKRMLFDFVNDQVSHHKICLGAWEGTLQAIANIDPKKHTLQLN